jgi:hypothetical protein
VHVFLCRLNTTGCDALWVCFDLLRHAKNHDTPCRSSVLLFPDAVAFTKVVLRLAVHHGPRKSPLGERVVISPNAVSGECAGFLVLWAVRRIYLTNLLGKTLLLKAGFPRERVSGEKERKVRLRRWRSSLSSGERKQTRPDRVGGHDSAMAGESAVERGCVGRLEVASIQYPTLHHLVLGSGHCPLPVPADPPRPRPCSSGR